MQGRRYTGVINGVSAGYLRVADPFIVTIAVLYAFLLGFLNIAQEMGTRFGGLASNIGRHIRVATWQDPSVVAILVGILMLFLAYQLWLRKRAALFVLMAFLLLQAAIEVVRGMGAVAGVVSLAFAMLLLPAVKAFPARPDPASFKRFKVVAPLFLFVFFSCGIVALYLMRGSLGLRGSNVYSLGYRAVAVALGESGLHFQGWAIICRDVLIIFAYVGFIYLMVLLFRSYSENAGQKPEEHLLATRLIESHGCDSLSYFNLRHDKNLFFYEDKIFLAYRTVGGMAIISGDPVGPPELVPEIMGEFKKYCKERGWRLTTFAASEELVGMYEEAGLKGWCLGEEAIVDLREFTLEGRKVRKLRQSVNKVEKMGVTMEFMFNAGIPAHVKHELEQISVDWRGGKPETGFAMGLGRLMSSEDPDCLLSIAYDKDMSPIGFLYMVPMHPQIGYSLDVHRSMIGAPGGLTDLMFSKTALFLKERGYEQMSLHFLAFSQHYREDRTEPGAPIWRAVAKLIGHVVPVVSLYNFDKKFFPRWKKRYIVYGSLIDFPLIGFAGVSAESALKVSKKRDREALAGAREK